MEIRGFGKLKDGRSAGLYILRSRTGMEAHVTDYGATLVRLLVPDRDGNLRDVVLGHDEAQDYETGHGSIGGTVGRVANRISNAEFFMNGMRYKLTANERHNTLHGGRDFFIKRLWTAKIPFGTVSSRDLQAAYAVESMNDWSRVGKTGQGADSMHASTALQGAEAAAEYTEGDSVTFCLDSPDGDQGFPGGLSIEVTYTLSDENELHIDYLAYFSNLERAEIIETPISLTNHSYFNLNGSGSGPILGHLAWVDADRITETDDENIPTGFFTVVEGTPMDFREPKLLGRDINAKFGPLINCNGYDHNYVLNQYTGKTESDKDKTTGLGEGQMEYHKAAFLFSEESGIHMDVLTDLPGIQLYTANNMKGEPGKRGAFYEPYGGVCFETQFWPDTVNKKNFPGGVLRTGEEFRSRTTYRFSVAE